MTGAVTYACNRTFHGSCFFMLALELKKGDANIASHFPSLTYYAWFVNELLAKREAT